MKNILLLSRYGSLGASSRLRSYQYLKYLAKSNILVDRTNFFSDEYLKQRYNGKTSKAIIIKSYLLRFIKMLSAKKYDLIWIEYEVLPWLPFAFEKFLIPSGVKVLIDYDDAIFHRYDQHKSGLVRKFLGKKIISLMKRADVVVVGNKYIANYAKYAGASNIEYLPTVVDTVKYKVTKGKGSDVVKIGWIGTPATQHYLIEIYPVLKKITKIHDIKVVLVGARRVESITFPIDIFEWSEKKEIDYINQFDIGIMPLPDEPFARGKCGYKLIQYMACAKPVVASPVGVNCDIVEHGKNGFLASTLQEWHDNLLTLVNKRSLRIKLGKAGRTKVEKEYSLTHASNAMVRIINKNS